MNTHPRRRPRLLGPRCATASEKGQAALAIILGVVLVMVTVPLAADLLVTGQQAVVVTSQNETEALQAAQAGLTDFENHVAADAYYASPVSTQGYCSADGATTQTNSFLSAEPFPGGGGTYNGCDSDMSSLTPPQTPSGQTDPNDPGFSNSFDPSCATSLAGASSAALDTSYAWDLYSGSKTQVNSEFQFIVDARAVTMANINAGDAVAYVYVTGRAGVSGRYVCRSIKAAVNVLDPSTANATTTSAWGSPSISEPTPPPNGNQTVTFTVTGASGAAGANGLGISGGAGGLGGTVSGTFTAPADYPAPYSGDPIYFGTWAGNAGARGATKAAGYDPGGAGGTDGGGGGASSVFCIMPAMAGLPPSQVCNAAMPPCPSGFNASTGANLTQDASTGCIIAIASGGGGGGQADLATFYAGAGGNGGITPTAGGNSIWNFFNIFQITIQTNGGGAATSGAGGAAGNGKVFGFLNTANGVVGSGAAATVTSGGAGATYKSGTDGGGGGGGYWGGGGGGAGFLFFGAGGGGGGINWSQSWTNLNGNGATFTNGIAPAGTKNGTATLAVTTESNNFVAETYSSGCTGAAGQTGVASEPASPPPVTNATWNSVTVQLAGAGGGGAGVPPDVSSTEPYGEPGGVAGYIGATNGTANGTLTLNLNAASSPPTLSYELGCGGGGGKYEPGSSTVASGDNGTALSALGGTLDVASSTSFTPTGQVAVVASGGTAVLAYTGTGTGTLTGVTVVSGTTSWTLATGKTVTQEGTAGAGGGGFGAGGAGAVGANTGTAANGGRAASGGGGGATVLCLGATCGPSTPTCASASGASCAVAIAAGGGGGAEGTSDAKLNSSTVASTDNGKALSALGGTLYVASSSSFTGNTNVSVVTSGGTAVLAYTGTASGKLTGVTVVSGTTSWTLATGGAVTQATAPAGPGGPGWGGGTNGSPTVGLYEPGGAQSQYNDTWYWPDGAVVPNDVSGGSGTQNSSGTGMSYKSGNGTSGSSAASSGGAAGQGASQTVAGGGGTNVSSCATLPTPPPLYGSGSAGGSSDSGYCESGGGGGGGGFFGGGAGGGGSGGGYGGGGGSSYVFGYNNGSGTPVSSTPTGSPAGIPVTVSTGGSPFVPPIGSSATTPAVSYGAAGAGSTTTSTTAGASGSQGQNGIVILDWYYLSLGQPQVTDSCTPTTGVFAQGTAPASPPMGYTYFSELGPTTFEVSGGSGGSSMSGGTTPGASDIEYVTVNVQPGELFSYVQGCSGYLSLGGPGFAEGGSSGPTSSLQTASFGNETQNIGGTDIGGEAGGGGGASALCSGVVSGTGAPFCNSSESTCATSWTTTSQCVLAVAGGGGGAAAQYWQNGVSAACSLPNPNTANLTFNGGTGGAAGTITAQTYNSGLITPGGNGGDEAFGGDGDPGSGPYSPTVAAYSSTSVIGGTSTASQSVSSVTLYGTAGAGGGFEGGEAGQTYAGSAGPPVVVGCAGGGGSTWWLSVPTGINSVTGSMINPLTGTTTSTTGSGTVTIQGYTTAITAERSAALGSSNW